ncbi:Flavodoxin [Rhodovastum atsumiense]|uniref:Flavodoxin n=1 Tax=Rhodovastum atsumiense TaxID=504468 RepID=A0A5M6IYP9_9PROT|nr:flavodoxin FldA [Rhodovastum atsumiense]KAA5613442.1 flavodoxin FldA [Rhodovastum atsumiense]CAH2603175.1 Flavodoxin [Rhodovastum atsumiense]
MSVNVIFGSDGGATEAVASRIARRLQGRAIDIKAATPDDFENCSLLVLGSPTYGNGDLQSDWEAHLDKLTGANLVGRRVALFGTGDQVTYPDSFVDAMGILYDHVVNRGATVVGFTETKGYDYTASLAERDGRFVGLALDQDSQASRSEKRISAWIESLG